MVKSIQKLRKPSHIIFRVVEGDVIILNTENSLYYVLDNVGARIWQWLQAGKSADEIIEAIYENYIVNKKDKVKEDVEELTQDMLKEGLLEVCES